MRHTLLTLALSLAAAAPAAAQGSADFNWHGTLAAGKTLEIKGVIGDIRASAASGSEVVVTARKHARHSDPDEVKIQVVPSGDGVTICAVYPTPRRARHENECAPGDGGHMSTDDNDVAVDFTVQVPAGVRFHASDVNGSVDADGLAADAELETVNGDVSVTTGGVVEATTVNGSIDATVGKNVWDGTLHFETVNGRIALRMPDGLNTDLKASTVNGRITSDFPVTVQGAMSPRELRGRIGNGGRSLELETVNGSIEIRKK
jgi:hypothetical protein